jgi:hypothetical protein
MEEFRAYLIWLYGTDHRVAARYARDVGIYDGTVRKWIDGTTPPNWELIAWSAMARSLANILFTIRP